MIFGKEPAIIIGFIGAVLTGAAGLGLDFLNAGQAAAITTALTGLATAYFTRPVAPALYVAALGPVAVLFAEYGLNLSEESVTAVGTIILAGFALFGRAQVTPKANQAPIAPANGTVR